MDRSASHKLGEKTRSRPTGSRGEGLLRRAWGFTWRFRLTLGGKVMLSAIMLAGVTCTVTLTIPIYHVFCALVAVYLVNSLFAVLFRPRLAVSGQMPDRAVAGHDVVGVFTVTNRSRRSAYDVGLGFFALPGEVACPPGPGMLPRLGPGESGRVDVALRPARRGLYRLGDLLAYSSFPFNLSRNFPQRCRCGSLLVLPSFHRLAGVDIPIGERHQPGGIALSSKVGESPEYVGSREWRPGDPTNRMDFRSWARLASPVVKEYREEYYCRVALVLDTFIRPRRRVPAAGYAPLEAAVSLSAAAAEALCRGEYIIDFFAAGGELHVFRAGRHTAHLENVLEILACVEPCRSDPFGLIWPELADELGNISAVLFVLLDWDSTRRRWVRAGVEAGCSTKVIVVRDGATSEPTGEDETLLVTTGKLPRDFVPKPIWHLKLADDVHLTSLPGYLEISEQPLVGLKGNSGLGLKIAGRYPSALELGTQ